MENKKWSDGSSVYSVGWGCNPERGWRTGYLTFKDGSRFQNADMPGRDSANAAQEDLDAWAGKRGMKPHN